MTTGLVTSGTTNSTTFYSQRSWSGEDGKNYTEPEHDIVTVFDPGSSYLPPSERGSRETRRRISPDLPEKWNAYSCGHRKGLNLPGVGGNRIDLGYAYSFQTSFVQLSSNDVLDLLNSLASEVQDHEFNLGIALAEGRETVALVQNTIVRFYRSIKLLKKGRLERAIRELGSVPKPYHRVDNVLQGKSLERLLGNKHVRVKGANQELTTKEISALWLQIQYGWKPLISDAYEACNAYSALADKPRTSRLTVRKSRSEKVSRTDYYWLTTGNYRASRQIIYEMTERLSTARSLGLVDPLSIAWELVPFSFVADWFIPIGSYLDALNTIPHLDGRFLQTDLHRWEGMCTGRSDPGHTVYKGCLASGMRTDMTRQVLTGLSVPKPSFTPFDKAMSSGHITNALALLHQLVT